MRTVQEHRHARAPVIDLAAIGVRVDTALEAFLDERDETAARLFGRDRQECEWWAAAIASARVAVAGGKRLRPLFCVLGAVGAGGDVEAPDLTRAAASLELLQTSALMHDDLLDRSDTRRGQPAMHRQHEHEHVGAGWDGPAGHYGVSVAILLGDLLQGWAVQMLDGCGAPPERLAAARAVLNDMFLELIGGQYLDILGEVMRHRPGAPGVTPIAHYKTTKYTIERPLHLGAALEGAGQRLLAGYTGYATPLGEAYQLRDDLLDAFGDSARTGNSIGDDLRDGKRTMLLELARRHATATQLRELDRLAARDALDEAQAERLAALIRATGADARVEALIARRAAEADRVRKRLPVPRPVKDALGELVVSATRREH